MTQITRRGALRAGAAAVLAAPAIVQQANAQSAFGWRRFAGERIEVTMTRGPAQRERRAEPPRIRGADRHPGRLRIDSRAAAPPEDRHRVRLRPAVLRRGDGVAARIEAADGTRQVADRPRPMLADPTLTAPDYDWADMSPGGVRYVTQSDGTIDTLPLNIDFWILFWNKQMFRERGLAYPRDDGRTGHRGPALTDRNRQQFGFVGRGLRNANVPVWTSWLLGQDQETVDAQNRLHHRHAGSDLGRRDVQDPDARNRAAGRRRLQLERVRRPPSCRAAAACGSTASASRRRCSTGSVRVWPNMVGFGVVPRRTEGASFERSSATASASQRPAASRGRPISTRNGRPANG